MKRILLSLALVSGFSFPTFAQTTAAPDAPSAAATATAVCKDGTPFSGATLKGACRGHGGIDKKASTAGASPAPAVASAAAPAKAAASAQAAPGGGEGKVWGNASTKVYHCEGDRWYGKTKSGEYMSEADAKAKGFRADHGKACTK
ncbi:signal peptide protein [Duganella sp. BJB488]|uniref:sunset domain-containing protein n=1 Tax=unclassified Duganella TaxID=2636909 RepID=UPI000E349E8C|nr:MULTISPECIES: hypothetical protein [unclassified Duganella]RFP08504.1 signal peptide protein [Duganella sp. BJB489]RFP10939.1 signal peptide protein [Duganella sp. BJB488]RFP27864.1 signal peptide protein [Duganella sp. BJB480]